jgi:hypothetical protein
MEADRVTFASAILATSTVNEGLLENCMLSKQEGVSTWLRLDEVVLKLKSRMVLTGRYEKEWKEDGDE